MQNSINFILQKKIDIHVTKKLINEYDDIIQTNEEF